MKKFEYKISFVSNNGSGDSLKCLNIDGGDGWEAVCVISRSPVGETILMKRETK